MQIQDYIPILTIYPIDITLTVVYVWPRDAGKIRTLIKHPDDRTLNDAALYLSLKNENRRLYTYTYYTRFQG